VDFITGIAAGEASMGKVKVDGYADLSLDFLMHGTDVIDVSLATPAFVTVVEKRGETVGDRSRKAQLLAQLKALQIQRSHTYTGDC
jgi:hypothetical protein